MTMSSPFGALKQVDAGVLSVGYAEDGPAGGPAVLLLHGWPHDIHSFADVTPALAAAGDRVIIPFVRGYGTTRFLSDGTPRNGQQAAMAVDVIALMDALGIEQAILAGFDWGARSAGIVAFAELERDIIHERSMAGLAAARAQGKAGGRPTVMDPDKRSRPAGPRREPHPDRQGPRHQPCLGLPTPRKRQPAGPGQPGRTGLKARAGANRGRPGGWIVKTYRWRVLVRTRTGPRRAGPLAAG